ncbi:hypothetical protein Pelo_12314 [Pelomyxa schiedti]|nr:hypothetical protein Pelo_12314 [Pelomyxa schiedti]
MATTALALGPTRPAKAPRTATAAQDVLLFECPRRVPMPASLSFHPACLMRDQFAALLMCTHPRCGKCFAKPLAEDPVGCINTNMQGREQLWIVTRVLWGWLVDAPVRPEWRITGSNGHSILSQHDRTGQTELFEIATDKSLRVHYDKSALLLMNCKWLVERRKLPVESGFKWQFLITPTGRSSQCHKEDDSSVAVDFDFAVPVTFPAKFYANPGAPDELLHVHFSGSSEVRLSILDLAQMWATKTLIRSSSTATKIKGTFWQVSKVLLLTKQSGAHSFIIQIAETVLHVEDGTGRQTILFNSSQERMQGVALAGLFHLSGPRFCISKNQGPFLSCDLWDCNNTSGHALRTVNLPRRPWDGFFAEGDMFFTLRGEARCTTIEVTDSTWTGTDRNVVCIKYSHLIDMDDHYSSCLL